MRLRVTYGLVVDRAAIQKLVWWIQELVWEANQEPDKEESEQEESDVDGSDVDESDMEDL